ncbi:hypothetical protein K1X84_14110 [bacterium]|nr:hypothetical protein [bacterium]
MKNLIKFWILAGLILTLVAGWAVFGFTMLRGNIQSAELAIKNTNTDIAEATHRIKLIPAKREQLEKNREDVEELKKMILKPDSISAAMAQLHRLCKQFQVDLKVINFSTDSLLAHAQSSDGNSNSFELPILMEFDGAFLDYGLLIDNLDKLHYAINFTDLRIAAQEKSDKLLIQARAWIRIASKHQPVEIRN